MKIKPFKKNNLDACSQIYADIFSSDPWNESWDITMAKQRIVELLSRPNFISYICCTTDGKIMGFIGGTMESWSDGKWFCLEELFVNKNFQRKGIGTKLITFLEKELKDRNVSCIYLKTKNNSQAQKFYEKNSFKSENNIIYMSKSL